MAAIARGLSAAAIRAFLAARLRPEQAVVPPNVCDALVLWERERDRATARRAALFGPLPSQAAFAAAAAAARRAGALLWEDAGRRLLVTARAAARAVHEAAAAAS